MKRLRTDLQTKRTEKNPLNVVITGGSRGLGRAFAKEFSKQGDRVFILARNKHDIDTIGKNHINISGQECDIGDVRSLSNAIQDIRSHLPSIDLWINNAGMSGGARSLVELTDEKVEDIIRTNLVGTCIACKLVHEVMERQETGGAIFNLAGAGSDGRATTSYSVYGATKAGIVQFSRSLQKEWKDSVVDMHVISPGMMPTDLLQDNISQETLDKIAFLFTHPDLVAHHMVPRMKRAYRYHEDSYMRFLTLFKILEKLLTQKQA
jgi:chlorophyll(ide) b reductase